MKMSDPHPPPHPRTPLMSYSLRGRITRLGFYTLGLCFTFALLIVWMVSPQAGVQTPKGSCPLCNTLSDLLRTFHGT